MSRINDEDMSRVSGGLRNVDKLEALISHNESDLSTWLPLEYDLQLTYGQENIQFSEYLKEFRALIDAWTIDKIEKEPLKKAEAAGEGPF